MNKKLMDELVTKELEKIPCGDLPQNELRLVYSMLRKNGLSSDPNQSPAEPFAKAVEKVHKDNPKFEPHITDPTYFGWRVK